MVLTSPILDILSISKRNMGRPFLLMGPPRRALTTTLAHAVRRCTEPSSGARAETTVHTTAIIGLEILSSQEASGPLALQVVSCDESGVVYLWDVLHLAMPSQDGIAVGEKS
jgi:hypothetical protein